MAVLQLHVCDNKSPWNINKVHEFLLTSRKQRTCSSSQMKWNFQANTPSYRRSRTASTAEGLKSLGNKNLWLCVSVLLAPECDGTNFLRKNGQFPANTRRWAGNWRSAHSMITSQSAFLSRRARKTWKAFLLWCIISKHESSSVEVLARNEQRRNFEDITNLFWPSRRVHRFECYQLFKIYN